jgi:hypothetical protein
VNFKVTAADVGSYGTQIGRAAEDAKAGSDYLKTNGNPDIVAQGALGFVLVQHGGYVHKVQGILDRMQTILAASGRELGTSAKYYTATDQNEVERYDSVKIPPSKR